MREALRALNVDALSCDLLPSDDHSEHHIQTDAYELISPRSEGNQFNIIIAHPTCTSLCTSGNHAYAEGKPRHAERLQAVKHTEQLWHTACLQADVVILENPLGVLPNMSSLPKPQYIQPYQCGDNASKRTALFLHGARKLKIDPAIRREGRTVVWKDRLVERWANQLDSGQNRLSPSDDRWKLRSKTYPGLARVVAEHAVAELRRLEELSLLKPYKV